MFTGYLTQLLYEIFSMRAAKWNCAGRLHKTRLCRREGMTQEVKKKRFSVERRMLNARGLWGRYCSNTLCALSENLAPFSPPIRSQPKTNCEVLARLFPRLTRHLHVLASGSDWLNLLFVLVVIDHSYDFGFDFMTDNWKTALFGILCSLVRFYIKRSARNREIKLIQRIQIWPP